MKLKGKQGRMALRNRRKGPSERSEKGKKSVKFGKLCLFLIKHHGLNACAGLEVYLH